MMSKGLKPDWAGRELRLDPFHFPQVVTYATRDGSSDVTFTINERGAVIRQVLPSSGLPMSIALPANAFLGVAARAVEDEFGEITVTPDRIERFNLAIPADILSADGFVDIVLDYPDAISPGKRVSNTYWRAVKLTAASLSPAGPG